MDVSMYRAIPPAQFRMQARETTYTRVATKIKKFTPAIFFALAAFAIIGFTLAGSLKLSNAAKIALLTTASVAAAGALAIFPGSTIVKAIANKFDCCSGRRAPPLPDDEGGNDPFALPDDEDGNDLFGSGVYASATDL